MTLARYRFFNDPGARSPTGDTFAFWSDPVLAMAWAREALKRIDALGLNGDATPAEFATWWASWAGDAWANAWLALNVPPRGLEGLKDSHNQRRVFESAIVDVWSAEPWSEPDIPARAYALPSPGHYAAEYQERRLDQWIAAHGRPTAVAMDVRTGQPGDPNDRHNSIVLVEISEENYSAIHYPERWKTLGMIDWLRTMVRPAIANFIANPWRALVTAREDLDEGNAERARAFGVTDANEAKAFASLARLRAAEMRARIARSYSQGADAIAEALAAGGSLGGPAGTAVGAALGGIVKVGAAILGVLPQAIGVEAFLLPLADVIAGGHTLDEPPTAADAPTIDQPPGFSYRGAMPPGWPAPLDPEPMFVFGDNGGPPVMIENVNLPYVPPQPVVDGFVLLDPEPTPLVPLNVVGQFGNRPPMLSPPAQEPAHEPPAVELELLVPEWEQPGPRGTATNPIVIDAHEVNPPVPQQGTNWPAMIGFGVLGAAATIASVARATWLLDELRRVERDTERSEREREDAAAAARLVENERILAGVGGTLFTAATVAVFSRI